ncbi:MAG: sulfotransferase family 2 domain-containing protein, partial [Solirubrobacteraceae bacterium]
MRRDQLPQHERPTYVMPQYKSVYVAVSKAACTSLKWLVADVQGEDPQRFYRSSGRAVTRDMCIHSRAKWRHTPTLHSLSDTKLAAISQEEGWFVFTVVRHPSARLFSAWQSKLLLREPRRVRRHGDAPWFPRVPRSTEDVVEDFGRFTTALARGSAQKLVERDRHFMPQWREAALDRMPYTRVYDTPEIPRLLEDFERHLRAQGWTGEIRLRRSNETPLLPIAALFTPEVREIVSALYEDDFSRLGYEGVLPPKLHPDDAYPPAAFEEIGRLVERSERIGDLAAVAQRLQRRKAPEPAPAQS